MMELAFQPPSPTSFLAFTDVLTLETIQQLSTGPNLDLLNICSNITHLTLAELIWRLLSGMIFPPYTISKTSNTCLSTC